MLYCSLELSSVSIGAAQRSTRWRPWSRKQNRSLSQQYTDPLLARLGDGKAHLFLKDSTPQTCSGGPRLLRYAHTRTWCHFPVESLSTSPPRGEPLSPATRCLNVPAWDAVSDCDLFTGDKKYYYGHKKFNTGETNLLSYHCTAEKKKITNCLFQSKMWSQQKNYMSATATPIVLLQRTHTNQTHDCAKDSREWLLHILYIKHIPVWQSASTADVPSLPVTRQCCCPTFLPSVPVSTCTMCPLKSYLTELKVKFL